MEQMGRAFGGVAGYLGRHGIAMTGSALTHYSVRADGMEAAAGFEVAEQPPDQMRTRVVWPLLPA